MYLCVYMYRYNRIIIHSFIPGSQKNLQHFARNSVRVTPLPHLCDPSVCLSVSMSPIPVCLSIYLSVYLSACYSISESVCA